MERRAGRLIRPSALALLLLTGCSRRGILDPAGPGAARVEGLWWLMFAISAVVFAVVIILLGIAIRRGRASRDDELVREEGRWPIPFIIVSGAVIPAIVLTAVFFISLRDLNALTASEGEALEIEVVAHDWWWEVRYPDDGVVTANEIHIPVGERVAIDLTTADVIHSFWVPQLQVKMDTVNGQVNRLWLEADRPGRYRGICAEFCGLQHANMVFYVVAESAESYDRWLAGEASEPPVPTEGEAALGQDVFLTNTCAACHAIGGTGAAGDVGPDLTHLASRETIASGTLDLTAENLRRFIANPERVKPGVAMPPINLPDHELDALVEYLMSLD